MGIRNWFRQRVSLVAGQAREYAPRFRTTNALYVINNTGNAIHVGPARDVDTNPEVKVQANASAPVPLSAPGESVYLYSVGAADVIVVEITTDDLAMVFAMQVVVSDITSALDVSDRAGRVLGKVSADDGALVAIGAQADAEAAGNGSVIGILKRLRTLLGATGVKPQRVNAAGAGEQVVKNAAGRVFSLVATVAVTLRDGSGAANEIWTLPANTPFKFSNKPAECNTSIVIDFSAAGQAFIQYE